MYSTNYCIAGFYCRPKNPIKQEESLSTPDEDEILNVVARYFISIGNIPEKFDYEHIYKILAKELARGWNKKYRHLFIQSAATYIEQHQHHQFNLKDYRNQILKHTKQLIEEQKINELL